MRALAASVRLRLLRVGTAIGLVFIQTVSMARPLTPAPGKYIAEGGWASLAVKHDTTTETRFQIDSRGTNGHQCGLQGTVAAGIGTTTGVFPDGQACTVRFDVRRGAVAVTALQHDACRLECGARAGFEGDYLVPAPGCTDSTRRRVEDAFVVDYRARRYPRAAAALAPLLSRCSKTLGAEEDAKVRNDLAVTLFHLDRPADCRATLAPLQKMTSDTVLMQLHDGAPTDFDTWSAIARTTRHNLALCANAAS